MINKAADKNSLARRVKEDGIIIIRLSETGLLVNRHNASLSELETGWLLVEMLAFRKDEQKAFVLSSI